MKIDMHMHTRGSDGRSTAAEIVERAIAAGLDGICLTDHHVVRTPESDEVAELARKCGLRVFRGVEYSSAGGHMLLFGVTDELVQTFGRYADAQTVVDAVNAAGGAVVVSHPFKGYKRKFGAEVAKLKGLVAWEGYNGQCTYQAPEANRDARELAGWLGRRVTGGSDAHDARDIGLCWTEFPAEFDTDRGLVRALKRGGYRAVVNAKRVAKYKAWRTVQNDLWSYRGESVLDTMQARGQFGSRGSDPKANAGPRVGVPDFTSPVPEEGQGGYFFGVDPAAPDARSFTTVSEEGFVGGPDDFPGSDY